MQWHIGHIVITRIVESTFDGGLDAFLPFATPDALRAIEWLGHEYVTPEGVLKFSIHALVIEAHGKRIIVDTCVGNDKDRSAFPIWHQQSYRFLDQLNAAGFPPESFDFVLCTHLHLDHVGWNTVLRDGRWIPTFPNARYLIAEQEYAVMQELVRDTGGDVMRDVDRAVVADSVLPVIAAGLVDFVPCDYVVCEGVRLVPTPGHTAGHVSVEVTSNGQAALITGDFIHHPCQLAHPEWSITSDYDPALSALTREERFSAIAGTDAIMIGTHWPTPSAGCIDRDGNAYRLR
ncbi:MBL fold metallo-hydrolase [Croceicoccus ponticola]|uniref:MBL fold metallo-hydrolase n=1 Tax=Croceicoccus ponticola TaxID=2217664 RepID=A0A437GWF3_9SPHN|nr:MBL fold metallo-hydrolase [Croceicoccus ponticola]